MALTPEQQTCFGLVDDHVVPRDMLPPGIRHPVHVDVVAPFLAVQQAASTAGFDLQIVSAYRSFQRQLVIWSEKAAGRRTVLDDQSQVVDIQLLSDRDKALAIMRWSALPGCSRHHWGSDFDIYDAAAVPRDYVVQLVPEEVTSGGVFAPLHDWLDDYVRDNPGGFFRPYAQDFGAIAPERWHLSYGPVARRYERVFSLDALAVVWREKQLPLLDSVLALSPDVLSSYLPVSR